MTKKNNKQEDGFHVVEESLTRSEQFIQKNQNLLSTVIVAILALVAAYLAYDRYIALPNEQEAQSQMFMAERYFAVDSFNLALNGDGNYMGFNQIIENYGRTKSGNLANYYAGISNLKMGQFEKAIALLKDFKADDAMVNPIAKGAIGDAYSELGNMDEAAKYYSEAAEVSDNAFTSPYFLFKAGEVLEQNGKLDEALKAYETIDTKYHSSAEARSIEKYITRVKIKAGKN
jgi:tetratricopeptide (TPR) repeat protein